MAIIRIPGIFVETPEGREARASAPIPHGRLYVGPDGEPDEYDAEGNLIERPPVWIVTTDDTVPPNETTTENA